MYMYVWINIVGFKHENKNNSKQSRFMVVGGLKHRSTFLDLLRVLQLWLVCCKSHAGHYYKPGISQSKCQSLVVLFIGNWLLVAFSKPSGLLFIYRFNNTNNTVHVFLVSCILMIIIYFNITKVTADLFGRLSLVLTRSIARAILTTSLPQSFEYTMSETFVRLRYFCR